MQVPANIFREYDIRGVSERDLSSELAEAVGRAYGTMIREGREGATTIVVARDCRLSSPRLHATLIAGLRASGCDVIDVGTGPTPMLYFAAFHLETDGAVMITGSHNPSHENGFKMMRGKASFYGDDIKLLREKIEKEEYATGAGTLRSQSIETPYREALVSHSRVSGAKMKVVLDAGNGAGGPIALATLRAAGLEVIPLFCDMDGRFPNHHPDPTQPENLATLIATVKETGAKVGLALDGDADRLGAVDANGDIVWGDRLLLLFARYLLKEHPGAAILGEVKCSQTLYDDIAQHGGRPILWKTGHSLIKTKMKEEGALLGGEMSGHLFFADRWFGFDDAIYGALRLIEILAAEDKTIGELTADVPKTSITPELRVDCPDDVKFEVVRAIQDRYRKTNDVIDVDGARILFGDSAWGLVRASNTQPVLVLRFEAKTDERRDELRADVETAVAEARDRIVFARAKEAPTDQAAVAPAPSSEPEAPVNE